MAETQKKSTKTTTKDPKVKAAEKESKAQKLLAEASRLKGEPKFLHGFMTFVRQQGIVGLAIGLAIGTQANATVKSIVEGLINPIVAFVVGSNTGLMDDKWYMVGKDTSHINYLWTIGNRQLVFSWGQVLSSLITLIAIAAVIYFVVKGFGFDKFDKPKE